MKLPFPEDDLFDVFPVPVDIIAKCYYGMETHKRYLPESIGGILHKFEWSSYLCTNRVCGPQCRSALRPVLGATPGEDRLRVFRIDGDPLNRFPGSGGPR